MAWQIFHNPLTLSFQRLLYLLIPLCLSVAVVYKAVRVKQLRRLPLEIGILIAYMLAGLVLLAAGLSLIQKYWP